MEPEPGRHRVRRDAFAERAVRTIVDAQPAQERPPYDLGPIAAQHALRAAELQMNEHIRDVDGRITHAHGVRVEHAHIAGG